MNYSAVLATVAREVGPDIGSGTVASYIPALARVPAGQFGMALRTVGGVAACVGAADVQFSIQSISKIFSLTLALQAIGEGVWECVGREPSGNPFNSLIQLEREQGRPRNPFINAGAIRIADLLCSSCDDPKRALQDLGELLCGQPFRFDAEVAASERSTGFRNAALANFMKSFGKLDNDVDAVLDVYFHQCAITINCIQLAHALGYLANEGMVPGTSQAILTPRQARRVNALMLTCGTYDAAGEFAFRIGLPCKSGVGGGIVAVVPGELAACVWSPGLDEVGNSAAGQRALERFTAHTGLSVF